MNASIIKFEEITQKFARTLGVGQSMDVKEGRFVFAGKQCVFFYLEGFLNKQALERVAKSAALLPCRVWEECDSSLAFVRRHLFFAECVQVNFCDAVKRVLAGFLVFLFENHPEELLAAEVRTTPQRSIQEPSKGKTLRGPHEGFCENIVTNLALLRRRLKSEHLRAKEVVLGDLTQTRVALCYLEGTADKELVRETEEKLRAIREKTVGMGEETLTEKLFYRGKWSVFNPLPRARFSERPDTCAAELCEGKIVLLIDTTPNAIILPMTLFEYFEECDNYYFPPLTATYLRIVRFFSFLASVFMVPIWLLVVNETIHLPQTFGFLLIQEEYAIPIFLQLLLIEVAIDSLKLASLNTPEPLANSLSVVGGLLLGDFAVKSGWFVPQTILYSAIVTILNFIPNNYELGYSLKFWRILLIVLVELFGIYGLLFGTAVILFATAWMRTSAGRGYLFPLIPFCAKSFIKIFVRTRRGKESKRP